MQIKKVLSVLADPVKSLRTSPISFKTLVISYDSGSPWVFHVFGSFSILSNLLLWIFSFLSPRTLTWISNVSPSAFFFFLFLFFGDCFLGLSWKIKMGTVGRKIQSSHYQFQNAKFWNRLYSIHNACNLTSPNSLSTLAMSYVSGSPLVSQIFVSFVSALLLESFL